MPPGTSTNDIPGNELKESRFPQNDADKERQDRLEREHTRIHQEATDIGAAMIAMGYSRADAQKVMDRHIRHYGAEKHVPMRNFARGLSLRDSDPPKAITPFRARSLLEREYRDETRRKKLGGL